MDILRTFIATMPSTLEQGLIYAVMVLGVLITYSILNFPDMTVDGSFPMGGAISTKLILNGWGPVPALLVAALAGALAGLCTGLIHVKLKVRDLFSGIIMMTALYSINLRITGGMSMVSLPRTATTLFRNNAVSDLLPRSVAVIVIALLVVAALKILLDAFLRTRAGYLLRATGDNEAVVTSLARDKGTVKIVGLMLANALVSLSGGILCQQQRLFEVSMGTGMMVLSLASVIIGINLFRRWDRVRNTTAVIVGSIIYKVCYSFAIACGLRPSDLKLVTALLFLAVLSAGLIKKGGKLHARA
ncbi:MAG: ABC transporter permease [Clostridiales bacterium]|nr:ABC transporter permease [Clostridiales bacterium]